MVIWKIGVFFRLKWLKMGRKMGLGCTGSVFYIGGAETLPPPLSAEEENYLMKHFDDAGMDVRSILIEHNLRLVAHIVKKFENTKEDKDDLPSIGSIGLIKAIDSYKPSSNVRLATYASKCIENEILMHLRQIKNRKQTVWLYDTIGVDKEGNEMKLCDVIEDPGMKPFEKFEYEDNISSIKKALDVLSPREYEIIKYRYGLDNTLPLTQKELAKYMNISRSYVSRIEKRALTKLYMEIKNINN